MKCQRCQLDASVGFAFCPRCGNKLAVAAPAAPVAAEADRRSATVLFADLSGFTTISEGLDPEDVRALQTDLFTALRGVVERFDAFVEKFVGDAVMAVFGAPLAHEDDPQRALHAALEMHACVAVLSERWRDRLGHPLTLHIGINSGRVVAGHLGSSADAAYAVTGDAVNTAARLQAAAQAGQTLVSRATFELTQREFAFESCGTLALKGKAEALAVYRLLGVDDRPQALRGLAMHGLAAPLIGRDTEIERMLAAATRVPDGRAQVISLVGQAGVGKTRLVDALLERVGAVNGFAQAPVRRVVCSPFGQRPYGVTAGLFREAYGIAPTDSLDEARRKVADVMRAIGAEDVELALVVPVIGYILGLQSLDRIARGRARAAQAPDLHDLAHGARAPPHPGPAGAGDRRLAVGRCGVDRGPAHAVGLAVRAALAGRAQRTPAVRSRWLGLRPGRAHRGAAGASCRRCDRGPARRPIWYRRHVPNRARTARTHRAPGRRQPVVSRRGRAHADLRRRADTQRRTDGAACLPTGTVEVPSSIEGLLLSRVDRLPVPARRTLQSAAILGSEFDSALLPAVDPEAGDPAMLDVLCDTEWLVRLRPTGMQGSEPMPHPAPRYRFASTLAHEVVYQNLLLRRRTELHQRTGVALESLHGTSPTRLEDLDALCHHFSLGEDRARGARYLVAAGDWARGIYANDDALRYYARALAILRNVVAPDGQAIASIREHMGDLLGTIGRRDEAHVQFDAVLELARAAEDPVREGRVQRKLAGLHWDAGERETSFECLREGLRLLECRVEAVGSDIDADIELAHIFHEIGRHAFRTGDNQGADVWARRALLQAEHAAERGRDDPITSRAAALAISHSLNTIGAALARLGRSAEAVEMIERSVTVAQAAGLQQAACRSYANLGVLYATLDPGRAVQTCQIGLDTAKKIGDLAFQSRLYANLAVAFCALTQRCDDEGLQAAQSAIDLDRQLGLLDHLAIPLIVLGQIHQCHGNADKALRYYEEALVLAEEMGEPQLIFPCIEGMATLFLDQGDDARAESYFIRADEVCAKAGVDRDSLVVLPFLC